MCVCARARVCVCECMCGCVRARAYKPRPPGGARAHPEVHTATTYPTLAPLTTNPTPQEALGHILRSTPLPPGLAAFVAGAGGGACQAVVMAPTALLVTMTTATQCSVAEVSG